jgi:hypothetical protein
LFFLKTALTSSTDKYPAIIYNVSVVVIADKPIYNPVRCIAQNKKIEQCIMYFILLKDRDLMQHH